MRETILYGLKVAAAEYARALQRAEREYAGCAERGLDYREAPLYGLFLENQAALARAKSYARAERAIAKVRRIAGK